MLYEVITELLRGVNDSQDLLAELIRRLFRLRLESDTDRDDASDRDRTRLRGRLGATYAIDEEFDVGGRLVTGDRVV